MSSLSFDQRIIHPCVEHFWGTTPDVIEHIKEFRNNIINSFTVSQSSKLFPFEQVKESLEYLLNECRQGIYVLIRSGQVRYFAIIANSNYHGKISPDKLKFFAPNGEQVSVFDYKHLKEQTFPDNPPETWVDHDKWWASNGILCQVGRAFGWGTGMVGSLLLNLHYICANYDIPDTEFILNRRDIPLVRRDGRHPYYFAGAQISQPPSIVHLPVFSLYTGDSFVDRPWIIPDEIPDQWPWFHGSPDAAKYVSNITPIHVSWHDKKQIAMFRGTSTGSINSARKKVCSLRSSLLDVGFTKFSSRDKVHNSCVRFDIPDNSMIQNAIPMERWTMYKYLIYCPGHAAALRLFPMLRMNSVILYVHDPNCEADKLWFSNQIIFATIPFQCITNEHMIYTQNLEQAVLFLREHDEDAQKLANNALQFYEYLLSIRWKFAADQLST